MRSDVAFYLRDEAASIERRVGRLRVAVILAGTAVITPTAIITARPGVAQTLVVVALWLLYAVAVDRWLASGRFAPSIGYLSTGLDAAFLTAIILTAANANGDATFGPRAVHVYFYPVLVVLAGLRQSPRLAIVGSAFATLGFLSLSLPALLFEPQAVVWGLSTETEQVSLSRVLLIASSLVLLGATVTYGAGRTRGLVSRALDTRSFLFADLRDYTSFVERHGDVAATELIADYRRLVRAEVARTGGGEVKTEGDSFYIVFTSARQAVECAVGMLQSAERTASTARPIRVGVGLHAGEPVPHEGQFVGSAVNIAARLAQNAGAGELLVSEVIRGLLRTSGAPPMEERSGITLKGISDPPRVYAVSWRSALS